MDIGDLSRKKGVAYYYADGSSLNNGSKDPNKPVFGGIGVVHIDYYNLGKSDDGYLCYSKGYSSLDGYPVTNNTMELEAFIVALKLAIKDTIKYSYNEVSIISDSQYAIKGVNEWLPNWKKNGFKTAARKPISNYELWITINKLYTKLSGIVNITLIHVYGHNSNYFNEIADTLATDESKALRKIYENKR